MKWNRENGYIEYKTALDNVMEKLGIGMTDHVVRCELAPYLTGIFRYLNKRLILLGSDEILDKLQEVFDIFDYGSDLIVDEEGLKLAKEIGVWVEEDENDPIDGDDDEADEKEEGDILDDDEEDIPTDTDVEFVPYNQDRFIFSWTNVMSCLITRLKLQYAGLLVEPTTQGCGCPCGRGETWQDWESYSGGVWSDEEEYAGLSNLTTTTWRLTSRVPECGCGYRTGSTTN